MFKINFSLLFSFLVSIHLNAQQKVYTPPNEIKSVVNYIKIGSSEGVFYSFKGDSFQKTEIINFNKKLDKLIKEKYPIYNEYYRVFPGSIILLNRYSYDVYLIPKNHVANKDWKEKGFQSYGQDKVVVLSYIPSEKKVCVTSTNSVFFPAD
ncbi:hypothetical protein MT996_07170 [Ornithobacterium rhinotracheale]|uniref:hypothetical protein n=1 Tax=Ornithobacterium rhinotracheale TaxID=28251 RepID=UPI00129C390C|nr:hypothetical protein [Ornithobacterium rhinotracheale]UOH77004.1 hypothetical protein MT996_07170 [Ornithobacterium rhinotracheale]